MIINLLQLKHILNHKNKLITVVILNYLVYICSEMIQKNINLKYIKKKNI